MFDNIGNKIKALAVVLTIAGITASIIIGASLFNGSGAGTFLGIAVMVVGSLISWIASFALYGFGELVDKTSETAETNRQLLGIIAHQNGIDLDAEADDMWKCEYCGRTNYKYVATCACGAARDEQIDKEQEVSSEYAPLPKHLSERLYVLNDLKMKHLISQEEYNKKVNEILAEKDGQRGK